ncbi:hypothetical protein EJ03DRAFT_338823 [Teratosphaeria nubilosa]|uniref:Ecp2 effector protein domain-containing protein n=1 Tax=Teratosphaeria nubilosa TaxID=161662 RepID=A0A6G1KZ93_9PEZI|nr:hypothetical protein EJ03DRAFT_338823 [Teratosphaeria nubilosa]
MGIKTIITAITSMTLSGIASGSPVLAERANTTGFWNTNPNQGEQSCYASDYFKKVDYAVYVGYPWQDFGNSGCGKLQDCIEDAAEADGDWKLSEWGCSSYNGYVEGKVVYITFRASLRGHADGINACLTTAFPSVNGFNCPQY